VPRTDRGHPRTAIHGAWSRIEVTDHMRLRLCRRGIEPIAAYRCNGVLRRHGKCCKIERAIAWAQDLPRSTLCVTTDSDGLSLLGTARVC
jgi:hypothetical protein